MGGRAVSAPAPDATVRGRTRALVAATLVLALADGAVGGVLGWDAALASAGAVGVGQAISLTPPGRAFLSRVPVGMAGVGVIALSMPFTTSWLLVLAVLLVSLGWERTTRALAPLFSSVFLVLITSTRLPVDDHVGVLGAWGAALVLALSFLATDGLTDLPRLGASPDAGTGRVGTAPSDAARSETARRLGARRRVGELALVGTVLAVVVPVVLVALSSTAAGPASRRGESGRSNAGYWGFGDELDTAVRGNLGDDVVMRVRSDHPDLWRGQTYDRWDGRRWLRTNDSVIERRGAVMEIPPSVGDPRGVGGAAVPIEELNQTVTLAQGGTDVIFGASRLAVVDAPVDRLLVHADGTAEVGSPLGRNTTYTVTSWRPVVTSDVLRSRDPRREGIPAPIADTYLDASGLSDAARAAGRALVGNPSSSTDSSSTGPSAYDSVQRLIAGLGTMVTYDRDVPRLPAGADTVDQFLFVDRRGFCEQIATTLALWVRDQGIPARVAVGYAPGERSTLTGEFVVRARDAHAWVEVWFPGVGWQGFDPTASVPLSGDDRSASVTDVSDAASVVGRALLVVVVGAAVALAGVALVRRRSLPGGPAAVLVRTIEAEGARRGRPRSADATMGEYLADLRATVVPDDRLTTVARLLGASLFAAPSPSSSPTSFGPSSDRSDRPVVDREGGLVRAAALFDEACAATRPTRSRRRRRPPGPGPSE